MLLAYSGVVSSRVIFLSKIPGGGLELMDHFKGIGFV